MAGTHVVVDGSNIATEGRAVPSLAQLDEAVGALKDQHTFDHVTVVVDATFPNRIERKERARFEKAVAAGDIITPPAGAIGRGDAFILQIAERSDAVVLSNDSYQEFHAEHAWLFDEGRLLGGKPVAHVGWIFTPRMPVRGAASRRAVKRPPSVAKASESAPTKSKSTAKTQAASLAKTGPKKAAAKSAAKAGSKAAKAAAKSTAKAAAPYNEPLPFLEFVAAHPLGSEVVATVERFSSHGAYASADGVAAYVPLRNLGDPPPRSARTVLRLGETRTFVVQAIDARRRGIDLAIPDVAPVIEPVARRGAASHPHTTQEVRVTPVKRRAATRRSAAKKTTAKKTARKAAAKRTTKRRTGARKTAARKTTKKKAAKRRTGARKTAARKTAKRRTGARKTAARKTTKKRPAKRRTAKRSAS
jgi:hypothetical protein